MPGIHDAHVHLPSAGTSYLSSVSLDGDTNIENITQRMQEGQCVCTYQHAFQDWIVGGAFTIPNFDRISLDQDFPDTPIIIQGGAGHSAFLNTAGLIRAGYDVDNEPNAKGARFSRRADGSLTGELAELAMNKAMIAKGSPNVTYAKRAIKAAIRLLHQAGVTSCQEAATNTVIMHALRELDEENALHMNIAAHSVYGPEFLANEDQDSLRSLLDGVPLPPLFTSAGLDESGKVDSSRIHVDDVVEAVRRFDECGMTVKIRATGRGSTRLALDAIKMARLDGQRLLHHEIAHCNNIESDDIERFRKLNVTAELSPAWLFDHPIVKASNGAMNWDFVQLLEAQVYPITVGSDWGSRSDPSLLPKVHDVVRRVGDWTVSRSDKKTGPATSDKISCGANLVLEMLTKNGAAAVGLSEVSGSIEVGKRANFIMLDRAIVGEVGEGKMADFENIKVLKTWFEGELVWDAESEVI
ncbi:hypothetical protein EYB25_003330 [Talaromyces marneffei]|nr:hypothetical protein EYB25_003330 [Talaromyces marneffei]